MQSTVNENRTIHKLKLTFSIDVLGCSSLSNSHFPCRKWFMHMYIVKRDITDIVPCTIIDAVYSNDGFFFRFQAIDYTEVMVKRFLHICDVVNYGSLHIIIVWKTFNFFLITVFGCWTIIASLKFWGCRFWRNTLNLSV